MGKYVREKMRQAFAALNAHRREIACDVSTLDPTVDTKMSRLVDGIRKLREAERRPEPLSNLYRPELRLIQGGRADNDEN